MKTRIKQNVWGNWYGYLGKRRVIEFANQIPDWGMKEAAEEWLAEQTSEAAHPSQYPRIQFATTPALQAAIEAQRGAGESTGHAAKRIIETALGLEPMPRKERTAKTI